jgi:hypothetical protein
MSLKPGLDWQMRLRQLNDVNTVKDDTNGLNGAAIVQTQGVLTLGAASALSLTLAAPVSGLPEAGGQDGQILRIVAATAQAYVVTTPSNVLNGNKHIATFAAAVGNSIELIAKAGLWLVYENQGVTLS